MPVILTRKEEIETSLAADWKEANALQRPRQAAGQLRLSL
jgi:hypothetical protein